MLFSHESTRADHASLSIISLCVVLISGMLDHVNVMSHGVQTPLSHVAAVSVSSLETLTVMPYDSSVSPVAPELFE